MGTLTCEPWPNSRLLKAGREVRQEFAQCDADDHAEKNPDGQVAFEETPAASGWLNLRCS